MLKYPCKILLFSGKRKCGKDYITDLLCETLGPNTATIIKISAPIKIHWSRLKGLDYEKLLGCSEYKEKYRQEMISWSEEVRAQDYGYFCSAAVDMFKANEKPVWIVSDIRRKTDLKWFKENYGDCISTIRIIANNEVRKDRGWTFTEGIDDVPSECDLDDIKEWDKTIYNNGDEDIEGVISELKTDLENCLNTINEV